MERVPPAGVAQEQGEALGWVDLVGEEWAVPEPVQDLEGNVCAQNAGRLLLTRLEFPVTL